MRKLAIFVCLAAILFCSFAISTPKAEAANLNIDTILFDPPTDSGLYFNVHDAQTLGQWRYAAGAYFDYAHQPLEIRDLTLGTRTSVVDGLIMGHVQAALGFFDWAEAGVSIPVVLWEKYTNPIGGIPPETKSGMGDIRLETKFRILDNFRFPIGVAVVPFMTFPTGNRNYFMGNGKTSGGGKLVVEGNIINRVFVSMNFGYSYMPGQFNYYTRNTDAVFDDLLMFGLGVHGKINDMWSLIGEINGETLAKNAFKSARQTPIIAHGGARFTPNFRGNLKGLAFTVAAGGGLTKGVGNPDFHVLGGITYRKPRIVELEEPGGAMVDAKMQDKIIITQRIHFEFARSEIRPISFPILDDVVELLKKNVNMTHINVEGHTDWIGSDAGNMKLSERRSQAVVAYLVSHGIDRSRLTAVGYGKSRPVADNNTAEGRAMNRRTEFVVTSKNGN